MLNIQQSKIILIKLAKKQSYSLQYFSNKARNSFVKFALFAFYSQSYNFCIGDRASLSGCNPLSSSLILNYIKPIRTQSGCIIWISFTLYWVNIYVHNVRPVKLKFMRLYFLNHLSISHNSWSHAKWLNFLW